MCNILNSTYFNEVNYLTKFNKINLPLEYAIRRVQVNQDGLKLNGTHQLLVYAGDVNVMAGSVHTIKKNKEIIFNSC